MKNAIILHAMDDSPKSHWYPWLKSELETKGYEVHVLEMPNTDNPEINAWVSRLSEEVGKTDDNTLFVGHSIGCQTILRYLQTQKCACGGAVFVAGWFTLQGLETPEEEHITSPWLETSIDFDKVKRNLPKSTAIFSDNDPFVPLSDKEIFRAKFGTQIIVEHDKGHFTEGDDVTRLPSVLNSLLAMD